MKLITTTILFTGLFLARGACADPVKPMMSANLQDSSSSPNLEEQTQEESLENIQRSIKEVNLILKPLLDRAPELQSKLKENLNKAYSIIDDFLSTLPPVVLSPELLTDTKPTGLQTKNPPITIIKTPITIEVGPKANSDTLPLAPMYIYSGEAEDSDVLVVRNRQTMLLAIELLRATADRWEQALLNSSETQE